MIQCFPKDLVRSQSLSSRSVERDTTTTTTTSTPKLIGGHHHSRLVEYKNVMDHNQNKSTSTPCSPSSSSSYGGNNPITVAERRQTKSSKYLVTENFKSDFANKLSQFRQCETNSGSSRQGSTHHPLNHYAEANGEGDDDQSLDSHTTPDDTTATTTTSYYTTNIIPTIDHSPQIPLTTSSDRALAPQEPIPETHAHTATTSNQKPQPFSDLLCQKPCEDAPEEQSARYEVISKLADQLAEQIEQNDSLLYELGVVRSNNARLQAVAADKEDEVACLTQRNRQLESIILKLNSPQPIEQSQPHDQLAQVPRTLLNQAHADLCQVLQLGFSKLQSNQPQFKSATQIRHARRYSWSGAHPSCLREHPRRHTNQQPPRGPSAQLSSSQVIPSEDAVIGWTDFVDFTDRSSIKAHMHRLEAELAHSRLVCVAAETSLRSLIDSITPPTQNPNADMSDTKVQGLGLFTSNPLSRALRPLSPNVGEAPSPAGWPVSVSSIFEENHHTSSPLLALANFGFGAWGRKPDLASPTKPIIDEEAKIPSLITISDNGSAPGVPLQTPEKEPVQPFMRFGLRSFFNQSPGSYLSKADSVSSSRSPFDPCRKALNPSVAVVAQFSSQAGPADKQRKTDTQPEDINDENAPLVIFGSMLDAQQAPLANHKQPSNENAKVAFHHLDGHLLLDGGVMPNNPNAIVI